MIKALSKLYRERRSIFVLASCSIVLIVFLCANYRRYAVAIAWHCLHGDHADVGKFRMKVPLLWWVSDSDKYDTSVLVRATPSTSVDPPEIVVSPTIAGEGRDSDAETLGATQELVEGNLKIPVAGKSSSLISIHPVPFTLYCAKSTFIVPPTAIVMCHASKVKYAFSYRGASVYEGEAEAILSTIN
jgi:hypothetical protein